MPKVWLREGEVVPLPEELVVSEPVGTFVIFCYFSQGYERPDLVLGPYTRHKASKVMCHLACRHMLREVTSEIPEWVRFES